MVLRVIASALVALLAQSTLTYRGLEPGVTLAEFARAANRLAADDSLFCRTSARTAELMECGATITGGESRLTVNAFVIGGQVGLVSVTDSGGPDLVKRWRDALARSWGPGIETNRAMVQWVEGGSTARFTWRAARDVRWISLTLAHEATLARIEEFLASGSRRQP